MSPAEGFAPVLECGRLLSGFQRPWMIAGGWAIDLFLGQVTRHHGDVDVAILRPDQRDLRVFLAGWEFDKVEAGHRAPWPPGEWLDSPVHEVYAHQAVGSPREIEFLLNEARGDEWVFRRDTRIRRPLSKIRRVTRSGVPYMAPAIVLLYKAKAPTSKDAADFERVRPNLRSTDRLWLRRALETVHPGHPWLASL